MVVAMEDSSILHMNAGNGETSYANNSYIQKKLMTKSKPLVEYSIKELFKTGKNIPKCIKIADFGCSSGPNTFLAVAGIISSVHDLCLTENKDLPEFQVYLNDLPGNDFNTVFKMTPSFYEELKRLRGETLGRVFVAGVPGSFYGRLFPSDSIHFALSTSSLHWLSQVPDGLEGNKGCIYMSKKSPLHVLEAYKKQFEKDFSSFLKSRGHEIVSGGRMALELMGRSSVDPTCTDCYLRWQLLADSLLELASEGLVKEADIDSFNIPYYTPFVEEARKIIEEEGSFNIDKLEPIETNVNALVDQDDKIKNGKLVAETFRAIMEPMFSSYFGATIIDDLFLKFSEKMVLDLTTTKGKLVILVISLAKK